MTRTYTALFPFCGLGAGALGFLQASTPEARFVSLGGIDFDAVACEDFTRLTGSPAWCADVLHLSPQDLRDRYGDTPPDVVFLSPPCQAASGLLGASKAATPEYQRLNELGYVWVVLMLAAWTTRRPRLVLFENVPGLPTRAGAMLDRVKDLLRAAGYELSEGFHDCGVLGGLAQHRRRYLLVARHRETTGHYLYEPPAQRVRGCGEVLSALPVPLPDAETEAGPMHRLPRISWLNWVRLALIPAGGDWRDLDAAVNGLSENPRRHRNKYEVRDWSEPTGTVIGATRPGSGAPGVADPRIQIGYSTRPGTNRVTDWAAPAPSVTGESGRPGHCSGGIVADPRVGSAYPHSYGVLGWKQPSHTVSGTTSVGCGAYAVADVRLGCEPRAGAYGVMSWQDAAGTITGSADVDNGRFSVADPRRPPPSPVVIVAQDGTWHRPLTTLELALLQGLPATIGGRPLVLGGSVSVQRKHIGNAVPVDTARAIAGQMLRTLVASDEDGMFLSSSAVWVAPQRTGLSHRCTLTPLADEAHSPA
jgi:site-specific DNA-cytosine methylase